MKTCKKCKTDKLLSEFGSNGYCLECGRAYGRQNYQDNKQRYFDQAKIRDENLDIIIVTRKSVPCTDCGVRYPPYVMQFDHINDDKEYNISMMRRRRMAFAKIVKEMDKCEVVCANCHAERTNARNPSTRYAKIMQDF